VASGDTIADRELGQPDFLHNSANFVDAQSLSLGFSSNAGVAVDQSSIPNHVYVSDTANTRVLGWASVAALINGKGADIVIGQPDFFSSIANFNGVTASSLSGPAGLAVDSSGNLYVADPGNHRVLEYNTPFSSSGEPGSGDSIADEVFGQSDNFTASACNLGASTTSATANSLCGPQGVALDSMGNLYIADSSNNRVLEYNSPSTNTKAHLVFGQANFTTTVAGTSKTALANPTDVALDSAGNLYVADDGNSRVLEYNTPLTTDTSADIVFGQSTFTTNGCDSVGLSAISLCFPTGVALDGADRLYIADQSNQRVLEYNTPLTSATANTVFGQGNSTTSNSCNFSGVVDANGLCYPSHAAVDSAGDLFVTDTANNRVLEYKTPLTTNTTADVVLGQPNFSLNIANEIDGSAFSNPNWVALDTSVSPPRLYVADTNNNRVLGFNNATTFSNGAAADIVIGQPDFFSGACNQSVSLSGTTLCIPQGVAVDKHGNLYVADNNNSRVLEYDAPVTSGKAAHLVFGQPNVTTGGCNSSGVINTTALCQPTGVAVDINDNVYIADYNNSRVLKYTTPLTTDTAADVVLGQAGFTVGSCNRGSTLTSVSLCTPQGVAVDSSANVYVGDYNNSRVLQYAAPITNGKAAHLVFGTPNFTTAGCSGTSATSLCFPFGVALDSAGNLYVGDTSSNRILEYNTPLAIDESAHLVFGQVGVSSPPAPTWAAPGPTPRPSAAPSGWHWIALTTSTRRIPGTTVLCNTSLPWPSSLRRPRR